MRRIFKETSAEYGQRRANETGRAYLTDAVGCTYLLVPESARQARDPDGGGGIVAIYRPERRSK